MKKKKKKQLPRLHIQVTEVEKARIKRVFTTHGSFSKIVRAIIMRFVREKEKELGLPPIREVIND